MTYESDKSLASHLSNYNESDWQEAIEILLPFVHEVDQNAVQIWFRFYPLALHRYIEAATNPDDAKRTIGMQGDFGLENRVDTSHSFLYGHRYWSAVKETTVAKSGNAVVPDARLADMIDEIAATVSERVGAEKGLTIAISSIGLMTLAQVGIDVFESSTGAGITPTGLIAKPPEAVVNARRKDDSQGMFGFLKTVDQKFSVTHDERANLRFHIMNDQEIASASAHDRSQDWQFRDQRCWEGPVPVECTSASCGTCWVGVIAGAEKLSEVERRERRAVRVFGYNQTENDKPLIRLACQAKAYGNVTIVIPPWNAVFGKKVYGNVDELELEPVTTSAKTLREITREATVGE